MGGRGSGVGGRGSGVGGRGSGVGGRGSGVGGRGWGVGGRGSGVGDLGRGRDAGYSRDEYYIVLVRIGMCPLARPAGTYGRLIVGTGTPVYLLYLPYRAYPFTGVS